MLSESLISDLVFSEMIGNDNMVSRSTVFCFIYLNYNVRKYFRLQVTNFNQIIFKY